MVFSETNNYFFVTFTDNVRLTNFFFIGMYTWKCNNNERILPYSSGNFSFSCSSIRSISSLMDLRAASAPRCPNFDWPKCPEMIWARSASAANHNFVYTLYLARLVASEIVVKVIWMVANCTSYCINKLMVKRNVLVIYWPREIGGMSMRTCSSSSVLWNLRFRSSKFARSSASKAAM